ncbi:ODFP1 protein, partial [Spelaeornis formosus]|nr:ODFP1 protein [Elachura formosa]
SRMKRLCRMLSPCCSPCNLDLVCVKGFDPRDVTVTVRDGKMIMSAEHCEEHNTCMGKTHNYCKMMKEVSLPPCLDKEEVTYSV